MSSEITPARLAEMLAAATPGPWHVANDAPAYAIYTKVGGRRVVQTANQNNWRKFGFSEAWQGIESEHDAALIALSPALAARVIELEGEVSRLAAEWDAAEAEIARLREALTYIADHNNDFLKDGDRATRTCLDALVAKARTALETPND